MRSGDRTRDLLQQGRALTDCAILAPKEGSFLRAIEALDVSIPFLSLRSVKEPTNGETISRGNIVKEARKGYVYRNVGRVALIFSNIIN